MLLEKKKKNQICKLGNLDEISPFQRMGVMKNEIACFLEAPLGGKREKQTPMHPRDDRDGSSEPVLRFLTCQAWMESIAPLQGASLA